MKVLLLSKMEFWEKLIFDDVQNVGGSSEKKVLDLGCGYPGYFFYLLHKSSYKSLLGIDKASIEDVVMNRYQYRKSQWVSSYRTDNISNWYNFYKEFVRKESIGVPLLSEHFDEALKISFNQDIEIFLDATHEDDQRYHLIILKNSGSFNPARILGLFSIITHISSSS